VRGKRIGCIIIVTALVAGLVAWHFLTPSASKDDRQQILEIVARVEQAIEEKKVSQALDHVSQDYYDESGNDRRSLQRLAIAAFREAEAFELVVQVTDLQIDGDQATLIADVDFAVGQPVAAGSSTRLQVAAELRREPGGWKVTKAGGWQGASEQF